MLKLCSVVIAAVLSISAVQAKELKVLMIGNSFSICVGKYLPQIVASVPGSSLQLTSCYIGGCTFDRHYKNLLKGEKNPDARLYRINVWETGKKVQDFRSTVNKMLKNNKYDIISIQQGSLQSWDFKFYEPYAGDVIKYIKKHQPQAEIIIQQTWSYRSDSSRLKKWKFDQNTMYEKVNSAYRLLAEKYQLRVIPVGAAVQLFRQRTPVKFTACKNREEFKKPAVPGSEGDVVGKYLWRVDRKTGKEFLGADQIHLNSNGEYMQSLIWFAMLYNEPLEKVKFVPGNMSKDMDSLLRSCAADAVKNYKQVK